ncbi:MAG: hypothetical protein AN487_01790 [Anabaena sp. CRKS33]|nr:MAG: hypothetical protein AN487_01790 [Anabaena sp. CRKS33]
MLRIFSTHRLFTFLLTGLMITSCGGGTSSNTPTTGTSSGTSNNTSGGGGRQGLTNRGSGRTTGTNPIIDIRRQNAQDTYADCVRAGNDPSLNCDLDLRGVP